MPLDFEIRLGVIVDESGLGRRLVGEGDTDADLVPSVHVRN